MAPLGECLKSERNEFGNLVVAWEEKYDECGTLKANKCILIFEDDELDYTKEFAPDCCGNYPQGTKENRRTPYAQLGSIMKEEDINDCCGKPVNIRALHTDRMRIVPGAQGVPKCCQCDVHEDGLQLGQQQWQVRHDVLPVREERAHVARDVRRPALRLPVGCCSQLP